MSRTDLDAATLANSLRCMAGDGSMEWVSEPIQASVLLDIADMLDENVKLRDDLEDQEGYDQMLRDRLRQQTELHVKAEAENAKLRELVRGLKYCANEAYGMCARVPVGGERPFTCCPLYDFDAKKYRCEEFMLELGIEVGE